jgi:CPA2 family monovalent cation:H+ antiporter-2
LDRARVLVVTVPDETAAELITVAARQLAPNLPIIARAATSTGVRRLDTHGAHTVIHPELEGGLEVMRHTLLALEYPLIQVQHYTDAVRRDAYDTTITSHEEHLMLDQLLATVRGMDIAWQLVTPGSPLIGRTLAESNVRARTGASILALVRNHQVLANPKSSTVFAAGDLIGLIGTEAQVAATEALIHPVPPPLTTHDSADTSSAPATVAEA